MGGMFKVCYLARVLKLNVRSSVCLFYFGYTIRPLNLSIPNFLIVYVYPTMLVFVAVDVMNK